MLYVMRFVNISETHFQQGTKTRPVSVVIIRHYYPTKYFVYYQTFNYI